MIIKLLKNLKYFSTFPPDFFFGPRVGQLGPQKNQHELGPEGAQFRGPLGPFPSLCEFTPIVLFLGVEAPVFC